MQNSRIIGAGLRSKANVNLMGGTALQEQAAKNLHEIRTRGPTYSDANQTRPIQDHHAPTTSYPHRSGSFVSQPSSPLHQYSSIVTGHSSSPLYEPRSSQVQSTPNRLYSRQSSVRGHSIIGDRTEYIERQVPKRVKKETIVKKKKLVPVEQEEEVQQDDVIEIKEKIIEVAGHREVPQETQTIYNEIVKERKVKKQEVIEKKIPRIVYKEKLVEVPEIEYVEVPVEKVVEIPQEEEKVVYKEVKVPQIVDRYVPVHVDVDQPVDVHRRIPVPHEAVTKYTFEVPKLKPKYKRKELPIYAPRFVEVPVPAELMDGESQQLAIHLREQIHMLAAQEAPALAEVEKIARFAVETDFQAHISCTDYQQSIENAWRNKQLTVQNGMLQSAGQEIGGVGNVTPSVPVFGLK